MSEHAPRMQWYAIHVKSRHEQLTAAILRQKGYEIFLPSYRAQQRWSDRYKEVERALFPGYLFAKFNSAARLPIISTTGVVSIVGDGSGPIAVDPNELHAIRVIVDSGLPVESLPSVVVGEKVYIAVGPVAGLEGTVTNVKNRYRLVVSVTLLSRSVAAEIERDWVRPVSSWPRREAGSKLSREATADSLARDGGGQSSWK